MNQKTKNPLERGYASENGSPLYRGSIPYLVIGGTIGAVLALLFAPKPGRQIRSDIADVSRKGLDTAREKARAINEKTGDLAQAVKEKADAVYDFASRKIGGETDTIGRPGNSAGETRVGWEQEKLADPDKGFRPPSSIG